MTENEIKSMINSNNEKILNKKDKVNEFNF